MNAEPIRVAPDWLDLREQADAAARSRELVDLVRERLPVGGTAVVHDLACGSGSMGRWLAPLLLGPQRWILHDRDADLLALAASRPPVAADGAAVEADTRVSDITRLAPTELADASLITASALLDLLTREELAAVVGTCAAVGCPVLFTLSVTGYVALEPKDELDVRLAAAFDAHQRRSTLRGRLLGPDAVDAAAEAFRRLGAEVVVRPSPWRLCAADAPLTFDWLTGWLDAAFEQEPALAVDARLYARRRLRDAGAGRLAVTVAHADLLVLP
jgi:hypothetical protein